ncbi:uncharacterized protein LOC141629844 [Silene latifolia]|uniref:uncharacterized protein LOC141629844 n=1 Tax=Silene latifolia TaxID=37657 RepID=UPI003D789EE8
MTSNEFDHFSSCTLAKEIWDGLELAYGGTTVVKKYHIDLLIQKYELFTMEPNESLASMSVRFSSIINELKNLGRKFESEDIARKVLRSLTKMWRPKVIAMEKSRDLTSLSYQELIGAVMAHELVLDNDEAELSKGKSLALQASASENAGSNIEDETIFFARRFKKKLFRNKQTKPSYNNNKPLNKKAIESKTSFINRGCFKYRESDHMIKDCPTWEKIKDKTKHEKIKNEFKQVMSCWGALDTEDDEGSEDEEFANLCLSNVSLDLISKSDDDSTSSSSECCFLGETDSDDEVEVSYLKLKKQVEKLSKSALIEYFEKTLHNYHEQDLKLKDLKEQILDITKENHLLKAKTKKLKSRVTANIATTSDSTNAEKISL